VPINDHFTLISKGGWSFVMAIDFTSVKTADLKKYSFSTVTATEIADITSAQIKLLSTAQVAAITSEAVAAIESSALQGLSVDQMFALIEAQIQALDPDT